jgi:hypothetical protein
VALAALFNRMARSICRHVVAAMKGLLWEMGIALGFLLVVTFYALHSRHVFDRAFSTRLLDPKMCLLCSEPATGKTELGHDACDRHSFS